MRSGKWWPWTAAWGLAAATAAVLASAGIRISTAERTLPPAEIRAWAVAVFALGAGVLAAFRWAGKKTHDPPERLPWERINKAKSLLAGAVETYWRQEAQYRGWERLPLMQVRWRAPVDPRVPSHADIVKNPPKTASSAEIAELAQKFRACEPRRLVILGGPGTGKTTLAVWLLLKLLDTRKGRENEPVPVTIPMAQWDTDKYPRLQAWLAEQLYQDYPGLHWLGAAGVRQLVALGHVLPILDGLDELPEPAQTAVIKRLNASLGRDGQVILTSRTIEYIDAVGDGRALDAAAVLESLPVTPPAAADYLKGSLQSHQQSEPAQARALEVLRTEPGSALAEVAATPLGLWLLRTVYIDSDGGPEQLTDPTRFPTPGALRAHLFDHLIAAFLPPDGDKEQANALGLSRAYRADDVKRWLGFLAHHLSNQPSPYDPSRLGTRDFEWWRLAATTGRTPSPRMLGVTFGLMFGLIGPMFALTNSLASSWWAGLVVGLGLGLLFGAVGRAEAARWAEEQPGVSDLRGLWDRRVLDERIRDWVVRLGGGLGLVGGSLLGLGFGFMDGSKYGPALGFVEGLSIIFVFVLFGLFSVGLVFGLWGAFEPPPPASEANSPYLSLRADRILNLARIVCVCLAFGVMSSLIARQVGLVFGLLDGLVVGPVVGRHRAWLAYVWATWQLSREGKLPRKLMPFLVDMHRLGLLRAVGRIYQFRHAELQDHLAEAYQRAD